MLPFEVCRRAEEEEGVLAAKGRACPLCGGKLNPQQFLCSGVSLSPCLPQTSGEAKRIEILVKSDTKKTGTPPPPPETETAKSFQVNTWLSKSSYLWSCMWIQVWVHAGENGLLRFNELHTNNRKVFQGSHKFCFHYFCIHEISGCLM